MMRTRRSFHRPQMNRHARCARRTAAAPAVLLLAALCVACGTPRYASQGAAGSEQLTDQKRELYARTNLEHARALLREGRFEHAESRTRRGLDYRPDDPDLLRLRADALDQLGRPEEAAASRARADAIDPRQAPAPTTPHERFAQSRATVLLLPPSRALQSSTGLADRIPQAWPEGREADALAAAVETRLPAARVVRIDGEAHPAETVRVASAHLDTLAPYGAISLRIERAYCGTSVKDGAFAVAWLRVAAARPGTEAPAPEPHLVRVTDELPAADGCREAAIARAIEEVLALDEVAAVLSPPADVAAGPAYSDAAARALFPVLAWRVGEQVGRGRRDLALGELARAQVHFERAVDIDPDDAAASSFLNEVRYSLALAQHVAPDERPGSLDPHLSDAQRSGLEAQLAYETNRREEMLSALAVLYETRNAPTPGTVANMRPVEIRDPSALGIALAMPSVPSGEAVEIRTLLAPDGSIVARYYFAGENTTPILREDDTSGDGVADRWVGYDNGLIRDVWEREEGSDGPNLHIVYTRGGDAIERIEFDHKGNGDVDRVFVYAAGVLQDEKWDTDGDGAFDRFQRFDESGSLTMREEDFDGDTEIDVRTAYVNGRIVRREILNSELLSQFQ